MPVTDSPLRYPGGKTQMKKFIEELLLHNSIKGNYVEPFAGGAGVALYLLLNKVVKKIYINDADPAIYSFWKSVLFDTDNFINLIENTPITLDEWHYQRKIYNKELSSTSIEFAFATFFLNRTNVSGIIKGGPIGGKKQDSKYKIDCRFNKRNLIKKIKKIAKLRENIVVSNNDAEEFINKVILKMDSKQTFIFFDPPYYNQGKNLYANYYDHDDHVSLSKKIRSLTDYFWITTYDTTREIKMIYEGCNSKEYSLNYSANNIRKATEILFYNEKVKLPNSKNIKYIK